MNLGRWLVADIVVFLLFLTPLVSASPSSETTNPSEWRMFGRDLNHSRYYPGNVNLTSFGVLWNFSLRNGEEYSSPVVINGVVYVGSESKNFYALNATTGSKLWNRSLDNLVDTSPAIVDNVAYVATYSAMYSINLSDGQINWMNNYNFGGGDSSPIVVENVIYIGSASYGKFYAINASTGAKIWEYSPKDIILSSPAVVNNIVYFGSEDKNLYALNASTGALIWNYTTLGEVESSPTLANDIVYIASDLGPLYALNASNGTLIWSNSQIVGCFSSPAIANGKLYVGSCNDKVFALNATTGDQIWNYSAGDVIYSSPTVSNNLIFFGPGIGDSHIYALNVSSGDLLWSFFPGVGGIMSSPAIVDGVVYITYDNGNIYAFGALPPQSSGGGRGISTRKYDLVVDILGSEQGIVGKEMSFFVHKKDVSDFPLYGIPVEIAADSEQRLSTITDSIGMFCFTPNTTGLYELSAGGTGLYRLYSVTFNVTGQTVQTTTTTSTTSSTMKTTTTTSPSLTTTSIIFTSTTTSSLTTTTIKNTINPAAPAIDDSQDRSSIYPIFLFVSIALVGILVMSALALGIYFFRRAHPIKDKCSLSKV